MSVVEPLFWGYITELTKISWYGKGLAGASLSLLYRDHYDALSIPWVLYELGSYYSNYFMTNAVQDRSGYANDLSHKINHIPVSYFDRHQFGDLLRTFLLAMSKPSRMPCNSPSYKSLMLSLHCSLSSAYFVLKHSAGFSGHFVHSDHLFQCSDFIMKNLSLTLKSRQMFWAMNGFVQENLTGFNVLKLYVREKSSQEEFHDITHHLQKVWIQGYFISG